MFMRKRTVSRFCSTQLAHESHRFYPAERIRKSLQAFKSIARVVKSHCRVAWKISSYHTSCLPFVAVVHLFEKRVTLDLCSDSKILENFSFSCWNWQSRLIVCSAFECGSLTTLWEFLTFCRRSKSFRNNNNVQRQQLTCERR